MNLAKQQMESMLEVLKEYEAEEECAAQVCLFVRESVCLCVFVSLCVWLFLKFELNF